MRRRTARLAALTGLAAALSASTLLLTAAPASACQPESCPNNSPVCEALRHFPKLPQCVIYP